MEENIKASPRGDFPSQGYELFLVLNGFSCSNSCPNVWEDVGENKVVFLCVHAEREREREKTDSSLLHPNVGRLSVLCWRGSMIAKAVKSFADVDALYLSTLVPACFLPFLYPALYPIPHHPHPPTTHTLDHPFLKKKNPFPLKFPLVSVRVYVWAWLSQSPVWCSANSS